MALSRRESDRYIREILWQRDEQQQIQWHYFRDEISRILEKISHKRFVSFAEFDALYFSTTGHRYEDKVDEMSIPAGRSVDAVFGSLQMRRHTLQIDYDDVGQPVFIFEPKRTESAAQQAPPPRTAPTTSSGGEEARRPILVFKQDPPALLPSTRPPSQMQMTSPVMLMQEEEEEEAPSDRSGTPEHAAELFRQMNDWDSVFEMFAEPYWPGASPHFRVKNRELYKRFVRMAVVPGDTRISSDDVMSEAKRLAKMWWEPRVRYFPQTMFLLYRLSYDKPDGFRIRDFDRECEQSFPTEWRAVYPFLGGLAEDLHNSAVDLAHLNLIQTFDPQNPMLYKVNKVVNFLGFHRIRTPTLSMIYQSLTMQPRDVLAIHQWMCRCHPTWQDEHNLERGTNLIYEMCALHPKMFSMESPDGVIYPKDHLTKIPLPMFFMLTVR